LKQDTSSVSFLHGSFLALDPFVAFKNNGHFKHDLKMRFQSANNRFPVRSENNSGALSFYTEYQVNYKFSDALNITAGLVENYSRILSDLYGDHEGINLAGFSQIEASPARKLKMVAGVRIEHNNLDGVNDKVVPIFRAGINWQAAEFTFVRGSFGQGYRYPSIAEKFAATTLGSVRIIPNPEVNPESGWSSEIGIKQGLLFENITGQADLSFFLSQNKDLIEFMLTNYPYFGFQATNVEQSRIYGYELEFSVQRAAGELNTTIDGGYTYIYPVEINPFTGKDMDVFLKYRRKHSLKLSTSALYKKFDAGLSLYAKSKILNIDDVFLNEFTREGILPGFYDYWKENNKGYFLLDGNIGYKLTKILSISFVVKNITNTEYMGRPGDIQPQRNYSMRISGKL
jgi:iron complex outermembrane receptor protein